MVRPRPPIMMGAGGERGEEPEAAAAAAATDLERRSSTGPYPDDARTLDVKVLSQVSAPLHAPCPSLRARAAAGGAAHADVRRRGSCRCRCRRTAG